MEIICNGEKKEATVGMSVEEFIISLKLDPETVVVEFNEALVGRDEYPGKMLEPGCRLEIIRFVGGG